MMNGLQDPHSSTQTTIRRAALLLLACVACGALAGGAFGLVCGGLNDLLHWQFGKTIAWGAGLALAGAATGAILGLFAMTDRLRNAAYWDRRTVPRQPDRGNVARLTGCRLLEIEEDAEQTSDKPPAHDSASKDGFPW